MWCDVATCRCCVGCDIACYLIDIVMLTNSVAGFLSFFLFYCVVFALVCLWRCLLFVSFVVGLRLLWLLLYGNVYVVYTVLYLCDL